MSLRTVAGETPSRCRSTSALRADRLLGGHVVLDDGAEHGELAVLQHVASSRPGRLSGTRCPSAKRTRLRERVGVHGGRRRGSGSRATSGTTSTSPWSRVRPGCWWSTPTPPTEAAREVIADLRRLCAGDRGRRSSTPTSTSTTPSATRVPRGVRRHPSRARGVRPTRARSRPHEARCRPASHGSPTPVTRPTFSSVPAIDLGDRSVELVHPGRGHTGGDLVVRVDDADVLLAGDLVEESGMPAYGDDCFPLEWPLVARPRARACSGRGTVVVPGPRRPRRPGLRAGAALRDRRGRARRSATSQPAAYRVDEALDATGWPYPQRAPGQRRTTWLRAAPERLEAAASGMSTRHGPRIRTTRLLLRRWQPSDLAPFADLNNDPEVMRHLREPMTAVESDAFVDRIEEHFTIDGFGLWALEVRATGCSWALPGSPARPSRHRSTRPSKSAGASLVKRGDTATPPRLEGRRSISPSRCWSSTRSCRSRRRATPARRR